MPLCQDVYDFMYLQRTTIAVGSGLQTIGLLLAIIWVTRKNNKAKAGLYVEGSTPLIFPMYKNMLWCAFFCELTQGLLHATYPYQSGKVQSQEVSLAAASSNFLFHFLMESLALILCSESVGPKTIRKIIIGVFLWSLLTFFCTWYFLYHGGEPSAYAVEVRYAVLYFFHQLVTLPSRQIAWNGILLVFYGLLRFLPVRVGDTTHRRGGGRTVPAPAPAPARALALVPDLLQHGLGAPEDVGGVLQSALRSRRPRQRGGARVAAALRGGDGEMVRRLLLVAADAPGDRGGRGGERVEHGSRRF